MMWSVLHNDTEADCGLKKVSSSDHVNVSQQLVDLKKVIDTTNVILL